MNYEFQIECWSSMMTRLLVFILLLFTMQFYIVEAQHGGGEGEAGKGGWWIKEMTIKAAAKPGNLYGGINEIVINLFFISCGQKVGYNK